MPTTQPVLGTVIGPDGFARPAWAAADELLRDYYDQEWGMPVRDEHGVYESNSLEAFQAGLSCAKILAAIANAKATIAFRDHGGLADFVWSFQPDKTAEPRHFSEIPTTPPESVALSKALRARGFAFVGPTMMFALMEAIGMIDTHLIDSRRRGSSGVWLPQ